MDRQPQEYTDGELIAATLDGRRWAFEALAQRYQRALYATAVSRLGGPQAAEDAVQETLLAAYKSLATYRSQYSFRTWLWTILLNQCRRQTQRKLRLPRIFSWSDRGLPALERPAAERPSGGLGPQQQAGHREQTEYLLRLLDRLPESQADALRLRFYGEMKFQEIADAMQCSLSTAKNRVRWGLTRLSQMVRRDAPSLAAEPADLETH